MMERKIKTAKFLAKLLDTQFEVAGIRFGFDPIINVIPFFGDIVGLFLSLFIVRTAIQIGVSRSDLVRMFLNIIADFVLGLIPYIGVIFDVFFKANIMNVEILEKYSHGKFIEGQLID